GDIKQTPGDGNRRHSLRPRLALDVHSGTPVLKLPSVSRVGDETVEWRVVLDNNEPEIITSHVLWPGSNEPAPEITIDIQHPARLASVTLLQPAGPMINVGIVDENEALIAF